MQRGSQPSSAWRTRILVLAALLPFLLSGLARAEAGTLETVRERGLLVCGVGSEQPGFFAPDDAGGWSGFDVDFCRAVAAAVFKATDRVQFRPLMPSERLKALSAGEVDLIARVPTWNIETAVENSLELAATTWFDGTGIIVRKDLGITSVRELSGASICMRSAATAGQAVLGYFSARGMPVEVKTLEKPEDAAAAYERGDCTAFAGPLESLEIERQHLAAPEDHIVLPEPVQGEPLGPAVRAGDVVWRDIVRSVAAVMIGAEERGVTSANLDQQLGDGPPQLKRWLQGGNGLAARLGLAQSFAIDVIRLVGNYGESFARNLGSGSPNGYARGLNRLWLNGGLITTTLLR
ncbi:MAG: transporter substrate-binding domain-containing protein [Hyphomicrobiaceae bacterium]